MTTTCRGDVGTRDDIERLVRAFYRDAAMDDLLGPIFEGADVDWPEHIGKLTEFWSWQLLGERGYQGNPLRAHAPIHARHPFRDSDFQRWLELFDATVDENFCGPIATTAKARAVKMAHALQRLLDGTHGEPAEPGLALWTTKSSEARAATTALAPGVRLRS